MTEFISLFLSAVKEWPWKKIIATAVAVSIILYAFSLLSCGVWRKTTTYGVIESVYTSYDTIKMKSHAKIPMDYTYEE